MDLGCGWGSFSLFAAEKFPNSRVCHMHVVCMSCHDTLLHVMLYHNISYHMISWDHILPCLLYNVISYPISEIVGISNSPTQKAYIEHQARILGFTNLTVITCDINNFT